MMHAVIKHKFLALHLVLTAKSWVLSPHKKVLGFSVKSVCSPCTCIGFHLQLRNLEMKSND